MRSRRIIAAVAVALASVSTVVALGTGSAPAGAAVPTAPGAFVPVTPANLLDTGTGVGAPAKAVAAHGTVTFQVSGRGGVPATGVGSVALTVAVVAPKASGFATVYAAGITRPGAASLDFTVNQTIANLTIVGLGTTTGNVGMVTIYNGSGAAVRLVANVSGYYLSGTAATAGAFTSVTPANLLDTGTGVGAPVGDVPAQTAVTFQVTGRGGIPATGVGSVALVVAAVSPPAPGYATVYAADIARPPAASLDFFTRQTIANLTVTGVSSDGKVSIFNGSGASVRLVANVVGYYLAGSPVAGGMFSSLPPANLLDTGTGVGAPAAPVAANSTVTVQVAGRGGVPYNAGSVALTVAVVAPSKSGFGTIYPANVTRPGAAALDFTAGQTIANLAVVGMSADGKVTLFNGSPSSVRLVVNVSGFWLNGPDTFPTAPVSDLGAVGASTSSVQLFWHNPTDRDFVGVKICHRTDTPAPATCPNIASAPVTATAYTETGLTAGTQYSYEVFALDAAGNVAAGVSASGTTQSVAVAGATGTITGTVRDTATPTQHPMANVLVHAYPGGTSTQPALQAVTAADGTYTIPGVPAVAAGTLYQVCFDGRFATGGTSPSGYQNRCYVNVAWPRPDLGAATNAAPVNVTPDATVAGVDGLMYPAGQVTGAVTDKTSGAVLGNVYVLAYPVDAPTLVTNVAVTGSDGRYLLRNLVPLAHGYFVCFSAAGAIGGVSTTGYLDQCYNNVVWNSTTGTATGTAIIVGAPGLLSGVDAALAPKP